MLRRTPLLRRSALGRRTPIRREAARRAGLSKAERTELDDMARTVVMLRQGARPHGVKPWTGWVGECPRCKHVRRLQWAHVYGKGANPRFRWDTRNAVGLCGGCHKFWQHAGVDPVGWLELVRRVVGEQEFDALTLARQARGGHGDMELVRLGLVLELREAGVEWRS